MPARRSVDTTSDLFSASPTATTLGTPAAPQRKIGMGDPPSQPRHVLPKDLAGALKQLDDGEINALLSAVTAEAECRGRLPANPPKREFVVEARSQSRKGPLEEIAGRLTKNKLNAVRAAFKAGVKPS